MASWLVKTEPSVYSIQDLKRDRSTRWDLVRNYQARNYLTAMKRGDRVIIYHSNAEDETGAVGEAEVAKEAYPDPSQFDAKGEYFDPKATMDTPRWFCPDMKFIKAFSRVVRLDEIAAMREFKGHQLVARGNRLSVLPLSEEQRSAIVKLVGK